MYLINHAAIGVALATAVGATNPVAAFGVGWVSHYLADFMPHGDEGAGEWAKKKNEILRILGMVAVDGMLFLGVFAWFTNIRGFSWWTAAAAIGSFLPDIMWGFEMLAHRKLFGIFEKLHTLNHNFYKIRIPSKIGIPLQILLAAALWSWLTLR
jgi:hypothetical protein